MGVANERARAQWFKEGYDARKREEDDESEPLTLDRVKQMSSDEINERWDEVAAVLEGTQ